MPEPAPIREVESMPYSLSWRLSGALKPRAARAAAFLLLLLAASPLAAQQPLSSLEGTVTAAQGEPLAGAAVQVDGRRAAVTDAAGRFRVPGLSPGAHTVSASRLAYRPASLTLTLAAGETGRADLRLAEDALAVDGLVVSVSREAQRRAETAAAVDAVSGEQLRALRPTHPAEVLNRIAGVWISAGSGEGHQTAIRQPKGTKPVYLFLEDGVPTRSTGFFNHNALYEVNVPQAERVEVVKGPATALYGSDAIGGVINVSTRAPSADPTLEGSVEGGPGGFGRMLATASATRGRDGVRADLNLTRTTGWREETPYDRRSATLRWDHFLPGGASVRTVAAYSWIGQVDGSALSADRFRTDPTANLNPVATRDVRAFRLSAAFEKPAGASLWSVTPFVRDNSMRLVPFWQLSYDPVVYTTGHRSLGVLAKYRRDFEAMRARVIAGVDVDWSPGFRDESVITLQKEGDVYASYRHGEKVYDYAVTFHGVSPYVQAEASPLERLRLTGGLRFDAVGYDYHTRLDPLSTGAHRRPDDASPSYRHLSPKLGATYELGPALSLYGAYGHGFRAPSEGQLFRQGSAASTVDLKPVRADNLEAGFRGEALGRLSYSLSAYRMTIRDDILTYRETDGNRVTSNAGETLHRGVEVGVGAALPAGLRVDGSWSRARHTYEAWAPSPTLDYAGNEIESAPRTLAGAALSWAPRGAAGSLLAVDWSRVGSYWMDPENTHRYDGHDLVGVRGSLPVGRGVELSARVANLFGERYAETAAYSAFSKEELTPGLPRSLYLGVRWTGERGGGR
jgi:outer membrane receptor protein involved in Fe transport